MNARHAREVLAQIEAASAALERALEILDRVVVADGMFPAGSRKDRLVDQVLAAGRAVAAGRETCRVVLGMEERATLRKVGVLGETTTRAASNGDGQTEGDEAEP